MSQLQTFALRRTHAEYYIGPLWPKTTTKQQNSRQKLIYMHFESLIT